MSVPSQAIGDIIARYDSKRDRLLDMLHDVRAQHGYISDTAISDLANGLSTTFNDVLETVSFYHFFHRTPVGKHQIYLSDTVIARQSGYDAVKQALNDAVGADTDIHVLSTACIGLSDQEPAMLVDDVAFTQLTPEKAREIVAQLQAGKTAEQIANPNRIPRNSEQYADALVSAQAQNSGAVYFAPSGNSIDVLKKMLQSTPQAVLDEIKEAGVLGRGGAGFPSWRKWQTVRDTPAPIKYIVCNADEGEPGTFKDRVLMTRRAELVFLGMVCAAWAVGSAQGVFYLRFEYRYLKDYLEEVLAKMRADGALGENIAGQAGFNFEIRIQLGAGAYVVGEDSAMIESMEGKRGTPRVKPPFPAVHGYLGQPTVVNNVETFAAAARAIEMGGQWYKALGTERSTGTRLISASGDCARLGVYEVEWGTTLQELLKLIGAEDAYAVQIGGASGECLSVAKNLTRKIAMEDLAGGALMVWNKERDLLSIAHQFQEFFVEESCGICTPCRAGGVAMLDKAERLITGRACQKDLDDVMQWEKVLRANSRCGLGGLLSRPLLSLIQQFPELVQSKLSTVESPLLPAFDMNKALGEYERVARELMKEGA